MAEEHHAEAVNADADAARRGHAVFECDEEIAEARLRALPFAVRCKDCEEVRENAEQRERATARKSGSSALFFDMSS